MSCDIAVMNTDSIMTLHKLINSSIFAYFQILWYKWKYKHNIWWLINKIIELNPNIQSIVGLNGFKKKWAKKIEINTTIESMINNEIILNL